MKILLIGSGAREHALAWKILASPQLTCLFITSANASFHFLHKKYGTKIAPPLDIAENDNAAMVQFAQQRDIDMVIIGPEAPLASGLSDALRNAHIRVFAPSQAAAQIETNKAFAKAFFTRHQIPTARYQIFDECVTACAYLQTLTYPVVIKASGLASGKGVFLPENLSQAQDIAQQLLEEKILGAAGQKIIIEERLQGWEVSLLAFSDGKTLKLLPPACDYKRLHDGDQGVNTGGMGAFAPATEICPPDLQAAILTKILQPTIDGLRAEGYPFTGVLYAGLMLTADGVRVLEFNCRFGDPETQVLLPLLKSDLLTIMQACIEGQLEDCAIEWQPMHAVGVVVAGQHYPVTASRGEAISGLSQVEENLAIFHAGTRENAGTVETDGGRILTVTAWDKTRDAARSHAYQVVQKIHYTGMQYRTDIGFRTPKPEGG